MRTQTARKMTRCQPFPSGIAQGEASCSHEFDVPMVKLYLCEKLFLRKGAKSRNRRLVSVFCLCAHVLKIVDLETILFITVPFIDVLSGTSHTGDLSCLHGQTVLLFASAYSDDSLIPLRFILLLDTEELVF